jgi:acyl-CoA synthetase (NDP forming)
MNRVKSLSVSLGIERRVLMRADELIQSALEKRQSAVSEYDSEKLLSLYGIPVTREKLSRSAEEAVSQVNHNDTID